MRLEVQFLLRVAQTYILSRPIGLNDLRCIPPPGIKEGMPASCGIRLGHCRLAIPY